MTCAADAKELKMTTICGNLKRLGRAKEACPTFSVANQHTAFLLKRYLGANTSAFDRMQACMLRGALLLELRLF